MLLRCTSQGLQSIWRRRCPSSHSHPGRMRLKCADESALLAGKDETFITAASRVRSPSAGSRGRRSGPRPASSTADSTGCARGFNHGGGWNPGEARRVANVSVCRKTPRERCNVGPLMDGNSHLSSFSTTGLSNRRGAAKFASQWYLLYFH